MRSFSSASDRRVYTGSRKPGLWRTASKGSASPARHAASSASSRPAPVGAHRSSGSSSPQVANRSAYFFRPSPASCRGSLPAEAAPAASATPAISHPSAPPAPALAANSSAASCAFTTRSASCRAMPSSPSAKRTGYTSRRMASATTASGPRTPVAQARHATASSDDTPTSATPSALAMPFAVAMAMRTPVNDPGPRPTHTHASASRATFALVSSSSMRGSSCVFDARWASTCADATSSTLRAAASRRPTPMATTSLAVSNASTYAASAMFFPLKDFPVHSNKRSAKHQPRAPPGAGTPPDAVRAEPERKQNDTRAPSRSQGSSPSNPQLYCAPPRASGTPAPAEPRDGSVVLERRAAGSLAQTVSSWRARLPSACIRMRRAPSGVVSTRISK